jgi:hypothetical protein
MAETDKPCRCGSHQQKHERVADLVNEQSEAAEEPDFLAQSSLAFGLGEAPQEAHDWQ